MRGGTCILRSLLTVRCVVVSVRCVELPHTGRYRATPIALESATGCPAASHSSEQYSRKRITSPQPASSFADTATLHGAIERPSLQHIQQTQHMQRTGVLPPFTKQQTEQQYAATHTTQ